MPITSITIENFKGIGEKAVTIPIRPITLLFGKNSSGKSTVLQALRYFSAIKQSKDLDLGLGRIEMSGGLHTDLDDFPSLVHRHELDRKIRIRVHKQIDSWEQWYEVVTRWKKGNRGGHYWESSSVGYILETGEEICFSLPLKKEKSADAVIGSNGEKLIFLKKIKLVIEDKDIGQIYVYVNTTDLSNQAKKVIDVHERVFHKSSLDSQESKKEKSTDNDVAFEEKKYIMRYLGPYIMRHLGPFREVPTREEPPAEWRWQKGLGAWDTLARDPKLVEKTNHYLKEVLQLGYTIKQPKKSGQNFSFWNFQLYDEKNKIDVGLSDVGVGISQVIPVVVGALEDKILQPPAELRWQKGLGAWDALARDPKLIKKTNHYLKEVLQLGYSIKQPKKSGQNFSFRNFQLYDEKNDIEVGLSDVGVGIAQVIPVVVGALDDGPNIFAVEQPELHVHPAVQVALGDLFIDAAKKSNHNLLIETHSEHLLLRLLRRVRETTAGEQTEHPLTPDDLSVIYVRPTPEGIEFTPISVTEKGSFDVLWPEGFFDERVEELF